jgi:NTP pyrophosphatase (non-canonical NTP hydrolase)
VKPEYEPKSEQQILGYLVEECGEVLHAAGKSLRWGLDSSNPEIPEAARETNEIWLRRELDDLRGALARMYSLLEAREYERSRRAGQR